MEHEIKQSSVKITLLGIGGAGLNTVSRLHDKLTDIHTVAICTDELSLSKSQAKTHLLIGKETTDGRGAGGDSQIGEKAARESENAIRDVIKNADIVFLVAGLAGGTGAGACYVAAQIAKELGITAIAFYIMPFEFEGHVKIFNARQAAEKINSVVDAYLSIENEKLLRIVSRDTLVTAAYDIIDRTVGNLINFISDLINTDNKNLLRKAGKLFFGIGKSSQKEGLLMALTRALNNPLIDISIDEKTVIILSAKGRNISSDDVYKILKSIKKVQKNAAIVHVANTTDNNDITVSVIAVQISQDSKILTR